MVFNRPSYNRAPRKYDKKHEKLISEARREVDLADHLAYVTLPLVEDTKFLLSVTEHVLNSTKFSVRALLEQKRYYKQLEPFPKTFSSMIEIWKENIMDEKNFKRKHLAFLNKMKEINQAIKTSSMRFKRRDKYILTNDVYDLRILDLEKVKRYLNFAKEIVERSESLLKLIDKEEGRL